ncbi:MAG TPA: alpha/beta hydrolase [Vicinamibacterales bacterium]
MTTAETATAAARHAEQRLWQHFGLTVAERFIDVPSFQVRVRLLECGSPSGRPLVFVHGGLGEGWDWSAMMAKLAEFRCITLDRPGSGLSDPVNFLEVDVRQLAVDVLRGVLDASGLKRAAFVANSMGGWWTFQAAMRMPTRITRMVMLGCPAVILNTSAPLPMRLISVPMLGRGLVRLIAPTSAAKARTSPSFLGHPAEVGLRWSEAEAEAAYRFGNLPNAQHSWLTLLGRFLRPWGPSAEMRITAKELQGVAQPTLFIWGTKDPFGSAEVGRTATTLMPNAKLVIAGIGHLPWWDDLDECVRLTRDFVQQDAPHTDGRYVLREAS